MIKIKLTTLILCSSLMAGCVSTTQSSNSSPSPKDNFNKTKSLFEDIVGDNDEKAEISMLNLFLTQMPKGGDLHHHYSGTIYAETYLDWVKEKNWQINSCSFRVISDTNTKLDNGCDALTVDELLQQDVLYRKLLTLWSDKDFANHYHEQVPPDSNFFNTFSYFGPASNINEDIGVNIIKARALAENVSYIETQLSRTGVKSKNILSNDERQQLINALLGASNQQQANVIFNRIVEAYAKNADFAQGVDNFVKKVSDIHKGIDDDNFTMRYQTYTARVQDPLQVFTELYSGFAATNKSDLLVGVNIVAPENNHVALRDYTLHMYMFNYLSAKYPHVKKAMHAGELTLGMVRPKDLLFHMKQARQIAGANRIGHGIDIPYEQDALSQLQDLKENAVVEINLTSNEFILGVSHESHPYIIYKEYGVPMVIATDDSGVSRNNLTNEYVLLASRYKPDYEEIKEYVYNSIKYSFMNDQDKAKNIQLLDKKFTHFESEMAKLHDTF